MFHLHKFSGLINGFQALRFRFLIFFYFGHLPNLSAFSRFSIKNQFFYRNSAFFIKNAFLEHISFKLAGSSDIKIADTILSNSKNNWFYFFFYQEVLELNIGQFLFNLS